MSFPQGRAQEEHRAARRAEKIAVWVREALNRPIPVRKLNVGHHAPTGTDDTSDQRRVVIILVLEQDEDANIDQSLRSAMAGAERARADLRGPADQVFPRRRRLVHVGPVTTC